MLGICLVAAGGAARPTEDDTGPSKGVADSGLVEHVTTRLQQIDVTVLGPRTLVDDLGKADFHVRVGGKDLTDFVVDRVCQEPGGATAEGASPEPARRQAPAPAPAPRRSAATYVFYFDQPHLTLEGRADAIEHAKELATKLVTGGDRAMILSNARELTTYLKLTDDPSAVVKALERLKSDFAQWDPYAAEEASRVDDLLRDLNDPVANRAVSQPASPQNRRTGSGGRSRAGQFGSSSQSEPSQPTGVIDDPMPVADRSGNAESARRMATLYAAEERWRQERDLRRLEMVLSRLADLDPPKAILYFADTMRANPGEHYLGLFGADAFATADRGIEHDAATARLNLDRTIDRADAMGIRFYAIEAAGLQADSLHITDRRSSVGGMNARGTSPAANHQRHRDAQDTLASMALETGGAAFLNGVPASKMAGRILDDLGCIYLLSFDPRGFPRDEPLEVEVAIARSGVKAQARRRLVILGDSARRTARLLASFAAPEAVKSDVPLFVSFIPTGVRDGRFHGRVQVAIPATPIAGATWDIGASLVSRGVVTQDASEQVTIARAGVPVVLESEMTFAPGPYEVVAVAHESTSDQIASKQVDGTWPTLEAGRASLGPVAVVQPVSAVFLRGNSRKAGGDLALAEGEPVHRERPTAIVGVVCRSRDEKQPLRVERELIGEKSTSLRPTSIPYDPSEPCAQYRDLIPAKTLGEGRFRYVVRVSEGAEALATTERAFDVVAGP